jgi:class 3 adenylate cyclase/DNA-binding beta-propeller fold protein YncE
MTELPSGTVTFLFTDIEGSTRLLKRLGRDRYEGVLAEHARILHAAFAAHNGRVVDTQGDEFFVAFRAAQDAVAAAVAAQRELAACNWLDGAEVNVRMGLHSGEPKAGGDRYVGIGVHRAARVGAIAHGGQVLLSDATRALVEDDLPEGVFLRDLGQVRLKDIDRPERIAQLGAERLRLEFPPLAGAEPTPRPSALRRRSLLAAMLAGVVAAAVAIPVFALGQGSSGSAAHADSLIRIDPAKATVTQGIDVPGRPAAVTTCAASVFVASLNGYVFEIDPRTSKPYPIFIGGTPGDISHVGGLATVVRGPPKNSVTVIDAGTGSKSAPFALPGAPSASATVATYGGDVWIANPNAHELERVGSPYTGIAESIPLPALTTGTRGASGYAGIAGGEGALWVAGNDANHTLWRVDPATRHVTAIPLSFAPRGVAAGYGGVWLVDRRGNAVVRVDPATNRLGRRISVGRGPSAVTVGADFVWVANELSGTVSRIDPRRDIVKSTNVGAKPIALAVGLGAVWVVRRTN